MHGINIAITEENKKLTKYYAANQKVLREDARNKYRNLSGIENSDLNERLKDE